MQSITCDYSDSKKSPAAIEVVLHLLHYTMPWIWCHHLTYSELWSTKLPLAFVGTNALQDDKSAIGSHVSVNCFYRRLYYANNIIVNNFITWNAYYYSQYLHKPAVKSKVVMVTEISRCMPARVPRLCTSTHTLSTSPSVKPLVNCSIPTTTSAGSVAEVQQ